MAVVNESLHNSRMSADRIGAFHAGAGDTEVEAAVAQYPKSGTDRRRVLDFLVSCGSHGATDAEIAAGTGLWLYTAAPRRKELCDAGLVASSDQRRLTPHNRRARVWVTVERFIPGFGL